MKMVQQRQSGKYAEFMPICHNRTGLQKFVLVTNLENEPGPGRSPDIDENALEISVENNPRLSTRELAKELATSQPTICCHLKKITKASSSAVSSILTFNREVDDACAEAHAGPTEAENKVKEGGSGACNTSTVHPQSAGVSRKITASLAPDVLYPNSDVEFRPPDRLVTQPSVCELSDSATVRKDKFRRHFCSEQKLGVSSTDFPTLFCSISNFSRSPSLYATTFIANITLGTMTYRMQQYNSFLQGKGLWKKEVMLLHPLSSCNWSLVRQLSTPASAQASNMRLAALPSCTVLVTVTLALVRQNHYMRVAVWVCLESNAAPHFQCTLKTSTTVPLKIVVKLLWLLMYCGSWCDATPNCSSFCVSDGYGPSNLTLDGNDERYELWEVKFRAYLDLKSFNSVLEGEESSLDVVKNKQVFSELVQRLDDKSLSLIIQDAYADGRKSMKILRDHYLGSSKPRIISLYCELAALKMQNGETVTDYLLRAETTASYLKRAGKMISDELIIAMIIRGLPAAYNAFSTVVTQRDSAEMDFQKFKSALKSEEETKKIRQSHSENEERVKKVQDSKIICYLCGKSGHKKVECKNYSAKKNRWCSICKSASHDTKFCRKKHTVEGIATDSKDVKGCFCFRVTTDSESASVVDSANLLVDCGATAHIICDKSKFVSLDKNCDPSKHFIELADGSRMNNIVDARGDARITLTDAKNRKHNVFFNNVLCIPSFKHNIFSVQAAIDQGASFNFSQNVAKLSASDGTEFNIKKCVKLYYLNSLNSVDPVNTVGEHTLEEWHNILGHCNVKDVMSLEGVTKGMKITNKGNLHCEICVQGKMCQYRNRDPDEKSKKPLELVHSDLAGPISPTSFENSIYVMSFVDDFSGLIFVYFLKIKSDSVEAFKKFLADSAPFGSVKRLRTDNGTEYS
ncbi:GAG-pre-integrase domain [Trinorchestia longiramus]|nr:GAG-pre-integrase domain [Trinorchestia longiramus]